MPSVLVILVLTIAALLLLHAWRRSSGSTSGVVDARTPQRLPPPTPDSADYSYSIWFYIDDWNYRYGEPKALMVRGTPNAPGPAMELGAAQNDLEVAIAIFEENADGQNNNDGQNNGQNNAVHRCIVSNIPVQRWANALVSVQGRTLDIYIDGKLTRTCALPGLPIGATGPLLVTPGGGFAGWTARAQGWNMAANPQKAWDIYTAGYGGSMLGGLSKYGLKIAVTDNGHDEATWNL